MNNKNMSAQGGKIAVIKTGGKQYLVKEKDKIKVEKLIKEVGDKTEFDALLLADDKNLDLGTPKLATKVEGVVVRHARLKKVEGVKYKPKTRQAKRFGHRQHYTEVEITKI